MKTCDYEGRRNVSGDRVRQARTARRYSQSILAAKVQTEGVILEQDAISRIENGSRMVQDYELRALANILGSRLTGCWKWENKIVRGHDFIECHFSRP